MSETSFEESRELAAQIPGKLEGLIDAGMDAEALGRTFGVQENTVNSWRKGAVPTQKSSDTLDGLVNAMRTITGTGVEPENAAVWLQSPAHEYFPYIPADLISKYPDEVAKLIDLVFVRSAQDD